MAIATKSSNGLCGVCAKDYRAGTSDPIEHRDLMLGQAQRARRVILCCSRIRDAGSTPTLDL